MKLYKNMYQDYTFIGKLYFFFREVIRDIKKNPILFPLAMITFLGCPTFMYLGREVKHFLGWFSIPSVLIAIGVFTYLKNKEKEPEDPLRIIEECVNHIPSMYLKNKEEEPIRETKEDKMKKIKESIEGFGKEATDQFNKDIENGVDFQTAECNAVNAFLRAYNYKVKQ